MSNNRILFISQEIAPYVAPSPLATLGRDMARNAQSNKFEVRTFMPRFGTINERRNQLHEVIRLSGMNICINDNDHPLILKVASLQPSRIQVYFIDNDDYFQKSADDIDAAGSNRADNDERIIFFARATMETVKKLNWAPRVVVVTGWMAALTTLYLRRLFSANRTLKDTKIIYIATDDEAQAPIDPEFLTKLRADGIPLRDMREISGMPVGTDMMHYIGVRSADAVVLATEKIGPRVRRKINSLGLPVLEFDPQKDDVGKITEFYKSLLIEDEEKALS